MHVAVVVVVVHGNISFKYVACSDAHTRANRPGVLAHVFLCNCNGCHLMANGHGTNNKQFAKLSVETDLKLQGQQQAQLAQGWATGS